MAPAPKSPRSIKVLSLVWCKVLPPQYGGQKAVAYFNDYLGRLVPLTMLCSTENTPQTEGYSVRPLLPTSKWQFINPFVWRTIYKVAKEEKATHLIIEFPYHGIAAWWCKRLLSLQVVVNTHNIESLRFREQGKWWWRLLYYYEGFVLRMADAVFFKTKEDKSIAQRHFRLANKALAIIPYGILPPANITRINVRALHGIPPANRILLFSGTLDYEPNAQAVAALFEKVAPLLDDVGFAYTILITGRNRNADFSYLKRYHHPRIIMLGEVADSELYFASADVFISPVATGGGIQTKLLDAIAQGLNTVCFASKAAGIEDAGAKLFAVPDGDWPAFVQLIVAACQKQIETPGAFYKRYDWRTIAATALQELPQHA